MLGLSRIAAGVLMLCGLSATGCRTKVTTVAVIPRTTGTLLWEPMHMGAAEKARGLGVQLYWNAPTDDGDVEKQLAVFNLALSRHYGGIILAPIETLASRSVVLRAVESRVPVVVVDDELGPPAGHYLSYVSNDEAAGARMGAERVATILHGRGSIAVLGISPRLEGGISREELFERALASVAPRIRIKARRFGDPVITHQQQIAQEVLRGDEHVDAIVALTATATRGAYYAKIATEPEPAVAIVGFDQNLLVPVQ